MDKQLKIQSLIDCIFYRTQKLRKFWKIPKLYGVGHIEGTSYFLVIQMRCQGSITHKPMSKSWWQKWEIIKIKVNIKVEVGKKS